MRLTLRTMLAYMDDILEPADHQDIGQKIEESEFATNLLHRVRDVTRQTRMAAPKVSGRGMGIDPNTVAEYLDNVLSGERVPDFEKVCLESDVHLAEVAACHQILSLVLGEPAEVDPDLRRRMYEIVERSGESSSDELDEIAPARVKAESLPAAAAIQAAAADEDRAVPARRLEVPEYLRSERRSPFWPIAITAVLVLCLLGAVYMALFGPDINPALKWLRGEKAAPVVAQNGNNASGNGAPATNSAVTNGTAPSNNGAITGPAPATNNVASNSGMPAPTSPTMRPPALRIGTATTPASATQPAVATGPALPPPVAVAPAGNAATPPASAVATQPPPASPPPGPGRIVGPAPANVLAGGPIATPGGASAAPAGASIPPAAGSNAVPPIPPPVAGGSAPAASNNPFANSPTASTAAPTPPPVSERLGRLVSDEELLLRLPAGQGDWQRVSPGVTLGMRDRLLALPTFHPLIALSTGVTLKLMPETIVDLDGYDAAGLPVVRVEFGRAVLATSGKPEQRVKLALGDTLGTLTFFDPDATAAVEVRHILRPGIDPQSEPSRVSVVLYATAGQIDWTGTLGAAGASRAVAPVSQPFDLPNGGKMTAPSRLVLAGSSANLSGGEHELPHWYVNEPMGTWDSLASKFMNRTLSGTTSVGVGLKELVEHRRAENRSLAARSMALIDEFDPFALLLNDPDQRAVWPVEVESLQAAIARSPATAGKVRAMLEKERGKDGDDLYRLLWGYNKDQLQSGSAAALVDYLDNDSLDFRVLAIYNLQQITGKTHQYNPQETPAIRAPSVRDWRNDLKDGRIVPKGSPPSKSEASAARPPSAPTESDAARGLEPPSQPSGIRPASPIQPTPPLPPPPNPGQD